MAAAARAVGHDVTVIAPDFSAVSPFPIAAGIRLRVLRTPPWLPRPARRVAYYAALVTACARGFDVCVVPYSLTVYAAWLSSLLWRRCRVVYVVGAYEPVTHGALAESGAIGRPLRAVLARWSYRLPVERIYASAYLALRVGEPGGPTIPLGIDHRAFHARGRAPSTVVRVGVIARRGAVKGHADLLAAWQDVRHRPIAITVVRVDPVAMPPEATVLGPRTEPEMGEFYRSVDIFVFTSLEEGFPAPPLEAMACGAAVISTRCGGVEEYAEDGVNALLVPVGDPPALARAIDRAAADPDLRARLAAAGVRTAAAWTRERTDAAVERLIAAPVSGTR
jgi:glycosyltransferase involved in cell wall biosynthesis